MCLRLCTLTSICLSPSLPPSLPAFHPPALHATVCSFRLHFPIFASTSPLPLHPTFGCTQALQPVLAQSNKVWQTAKRMQSASPC